MRRLMVLLAGLLALAAAGCGSGHRRPAKRATVDSARTSGPISVVPVSYDGTTCAPGWAALKAGTYEFELQNRGSDAIALTLLNAADGTAVSPTTPVTPGARASIQERLRAGGSYAWRCQTASQAPATSAAIEIPGSGTLSPVDAPAGIAIVQLYEPLARYTQYVSATLATLRRQLATLKRRLATGDVAGAKSAWLAAHLSWLAIGQDDGAYGAFGTLGERIDGTADGDPRGSSSRSFTGFHRVELDLWRRHAPAAARADAATLSTLVDSITQHALSEDLPDTTVAIDSWALRCHEILEDALRDTLSGSDDYGSHTGLAAIRADVAATREMLHVLGGLIEPRSPALVPSAARELATIDAAAGRPRAVAITALPRLTRQRINGAVDAALETLAPVSELIQISGANS